MVERPADRRPGRRWGSVTRVNLMNPRRTRDFVAYNPALNGTMSKTIFTRIIDGEIPGDFVYRDDHLVAIRDINPAAPVHILVIPRKPIPSLRELQPEDAELAGRLLLAVREIAESEGLEKGYRVVINTGDEGGQTVPHLHLHILGGRRMTESMAG
jgi:histidine triad (HIT) family protein